MIDLLTPHVVARFWSKVDRSAGPDACWPWTAGRDKDGYGKFQIGLGRSAGQRHVRAHRVAYLLGHGKLDLVGLVIHGCDIPRCCNPTHLSQGTQLDNRRDCVAKGRQAKGNRHGSVLRPERLPRGERHGMAKLTDAQVASLREEYRRGSQVKDLASKYGLHRATVSKIVNGRTRIELHALGFES